MHRGQEVGGGRNGVEGGWLASLHSMRSVLYVQGNPKGCQTKGSAHISCKNVRII